MRYGMIKRFALILLFIGVMICIACEAQTVVSAESSSTKPEKEQFFQDYAVKTYVDLDSWIGRVEVYRKEKLVYRKQGIGYRFNIGLMDDENKEDNDLVAMGRDITGKGIPNLVISEWSGGAHCCFNYYVFEIGKKFRKVAEINAEHSDEAYFKDLDNDKKLEFITNDWVFAYWHAGFAESPAPQIILRFEKKEYVLATDLMRKPEPLAKEVESKVNEIRQDESWQEEKEPPVDLWAWMLELIYSGQAKLAWDFFDKAWLENVPGKQKFLSEFRSQLAKSPYWPQIKKMNGI